MNDETFSEWRTTPAVTTLFTEGCKMWVWSIQTSLITGSIFLSPWNFQDRRGINPLNSINILASEQFQSGKRLLGVTILYNCMHEILWTLNNEHTAVPNFVTMSDIFDLKSWQYYLINRVVCALNCIIRMENKEQVFSIRIHTVTKTEAL